MLAIVIVIIVITIIIIIGILRALFVLSQFLVLGLFQVPREVQFLYLHCCQKESSPAWPSPAPPADRPGADTSQPPVWLPLAGSASNGPLLTDRLQGAWPCFRPPFPTPDGLRASAWGTLISVVKPE